MYTLQNVHNILIIEIEGIFWKYEVDFNIQHTDIPHLSSTWQLDPGIKFERKNDVFSINLRVERGKDST